MASNDMVGLENGKQCSVAVMFEEMELILFTVGSFGYDGALLQDINGIKNNSIFCKHFSIFFVLFFSEIYTNLPT